MSLEFKSASTKGNYIVDDIGAVVARVRKRWITADSDRLTADNTNVTADGGILPVYDYGYSLEVINRLIAKNKVGQRYPLIYLAMGFPEKKANRILSCTLDIGIYEYSKAEYYTQDRYEKVFKKTLYPLYDMFFDELYKSGLFFWDGQEDLQMPEHTKTDRPYIGAPPKENSKKRTLPDAVDCIEITGLKLNQGIKKF
jgi:hypothetical protein